MRRPRAAAALLAALVALAGLLTAVDQLQPISANDFFWHLKTGEWIWQHKSLPVEDPFAFTTPRDLNDMQRFTLTSYWLSQVVYSLLHRAGGFPAIVLFRFLLVGLLVLVLVARNRGDRLIFTAMVALGLVALGMFPLDRPQSISFALYGALLLLLDSLRGPVPAGWKRHLVATILPALMLVWANMHGAYLLGQATILLFMALEGVKFLRPDLDPLPAARFRRLLATCLLGLCCSLINPNTYHAVEYLRTSVQSPLFINVEYQSTLYLFTSGLHRVTAFWFLLVLTLVGFAASGRKLDFTLVTLLAGLGVVSFFRSRYIPFFVVAAVPPVAGWLSGQRGRRWCRPAVVCLAMLSVSSFAWKDRAAMVTPGSGVWVDRNFPEKAADFIIRQDLRGNMYNSPNWGGYLIWRLAPTRKVFSDGRGLDPPSFSSTAVIDSAQTQAGAAEPLWKSLLEANRIQYVVTPLVNWGVMYPLVNALLNDQEWFLVFAGGNSLIFLRASPENSRVIRDSSLSKDRFLDDAIASVTRQAAAEPGNVFCHLSRGELLLSRQRFAEARAAYTRVLELAPFNRVARERLRTLP